MSALTKKRPFRIIGKQRAAKLRKRGERVEWKDFDGLLLRVWYPKP